LEQQLSGLLTKKATLKFTKIHEDAVTPKYNYESDSGFDLHATEDVTVEGLGRVLVPTGLRFDIPMGHEIQVRPKSGLASKRRFNGILTHQELLMRDMMVKLKLLFIIVT
jgi:dUTPase